MFKIETYQSIQKFIQRIITFVGGLIMPFTIVAQNLVPNPSFEDTSGCFINHPDITCLNEWNIAHSTIPEMNTPDLCFNGAVFFPPSSIPALDGTKYIGVDCQPMNSEYVQSSLLQEMIAGKSYCVSFYVSICDQTMMPATSLGAYFSNGSLTVNPFVNNLAAHVQGNVPHDPTIWTKISGVYIADGGEDHITLGGFQNSGPQGFVYMYMDMVEVYEIPDQNNFFSLEICPDEELVLSTSAIADSYLWNTSETTNSIAISQSGLFTLEKSYGSCILNDTFLVTNGNCLIDTNVTDTTEVIEQEQTLFIPSAFTPNGDGINDDFKIYGEGLTEISINIFNRWGEIIFTSNEIDFVWNGMKSEIPAQVDVYIYQIYFKNKEGIRGERRGKLVLVR